MQKIFEINANTHIVFILSLFFPPPREIDSNVTFHISRSIPIFDRNKGTRATFLSLFLLFPFSSPFMDIEIFFFLSN